MNFPCLDQATLVSHLQSLEQQDWTKAIDQKSYEWMGKAIEGEGNAKAIESLWEFIKGNSSIPMNKSIANQLLKIEFKAKRAGLDISRLHHLILEQPQIKEQLTFIAVQTNNQQIVLAKEALILESSYFEKLLSGYFKEANDTTLCLQGDSKKAVKPFFEFLTTGQATLTDENASETLELANKYDLLTLKQRCETHLIDYIDHLTDEEKFSQLDKWIAIVANFQSPTLQDKFFSFALQFYFKESNADSQALLKIAGQMIKTLDLKEERLSLEAFSFIMDCCSQLTALTLKNLLDIEEALKILPASLQELTLIGCRGLSNQAFNYLPKGLLRLELNRCVKIADDDIKNLPRLLRQLILNWCQLITDEGINHLPSKLIFLSLTDGEQLSADSFNLLPRQLIELTLSNCKRIDDQGLGYLPETLLRLKLHKCKLINGSGIKTLPPRLVELNVSGCKAIKEIKGLPNSLLKLNLNGCALITDKTLEDLPKQLTELNLKGCKRATPATFKKLPKNLVRLNLSNCAVDNQTIMDLPDALQALELGQCPRLSNEGIKRLAEQFKRLSRLNLLGTNVTDQAIEHLPRDLKWLNLNATRITKKGLNNLPKQLDYLDVRNCEEISEEDYQALLMQLPLTQIIW